MKKVAFLITAIMLTVSALIAQPKAVYPEESFDFGNINQDQVVTHDFVVKNEGTEPLKIDKVRASCGCTAAAPDVDELKPGESAKIKVKFDSHGRKGVQKKYVYVFTNDPDKPQMRLSFTTNIVLEGAVENKVTNSAQLSINVKEVDFGKMTEGEVKSTQLSFINKGKSELTINEIKSSCDCISAILSSSKLAPNEVAFINIKFDSKGRSGELTRTITISSNDKNNPQESIVVYANVVKGDKS